THMRNIVSFVLLKECPCNMQIFDGTLTFAGAAKAFKNLIKKIMRRKHGRETTSSRRKEKLLKFFNKDDTTLDIFIFLRLVVAIQMCSHREVYEPLIPG
uniref:Uncharacterized protein n=1 Tax=Aegilops tauschii subsp. strangulata TaxID=200361 RepID=A0A453MYW7_AEGTS